MIFENMNVNNFNTFKRKLSEKQSYHQSHDNTFEVFFLDFQTILCMIFDINSFLHLFFFFILHICLHFLFSINSAASLCYLNIDSDASLDSTKHSFQFLSCSKFSEHQSQVQVT